MAKCKEAEILAVLTMPTHSQRTLAVLAIPTHSQGISIVLTMPRLLTETCPPQKLANSLTSKTNSFFIKFEKKCQHDQLRK
ncbi:hypothetical protein SLA2020_097210 [Shorea laevis]